MQTTKITGRFLGIKKNAKYELRITVKMQNTSNKRHQDVEIIILAEQKKDTDETQEGPGQ